MPPMGAEPIGTMSMVPSCAPSRCAASPLARPLLITTSSLIRPPALLIEALGQIEEGVVHRIAGADPAARLELERRLGPRDHRGEEEHDERDEDLHGHTSLGDREDNTRRG